MAHRTPRHFQATLAQLIGATSLVILCMGHARAEPNSAFLGDIDEITAHAKRSIEAAYRTTPRFEDVIEKIRLGKADTANGISLQPSGLLLIQPTKQNGLTLSGPLALRLMPRLGSHIQLYCGVLDAALLKELPPDTCQRVFGTDGQLKSPVQDLEFAIADGDANQIKQRLTTGTAASYSHDTTALDIAVALGRQSAVEAILEGSATSGSSHTGAAHPFNVALSRGDARIARLLYQHGIRPPAPKPNEGMPLHYAVRSGSQSVAQWIAADGPGIREADQWSSLLISQCSGNDNAALANWLISEGASVDKNYGQILAHCVENKRSKLVDMLLSRDGWQTISNDERRRLLESAADSNAEEVFRKIVAALPGNAQERATRYGTLHTAAREGWLDFIRQEIAEGVSRPT